VVFQPSKDKLYSGVVGGQAVLEQAGERRVLQVSDKADTAQLKLVVSRSHRPDSIERLMQRLGARHEMPSGSVGVKIGLIAEQLADLYVHVSDRSSAWDACGPEAVLRAAGGRFVDCAGMAFAYDREGSIANERGILACNAAAFGAVAEVVESVATEVGFLHKA
jgi:3'(2'), 5'-bisphosphate nucleotidase